MSFEPVPSTPSNELPIVPGLGLETIVHEVPFHRCMRLLREVAVREEPTAHALVLLKASTLVSTLSPVVPALDECLLTPGGRGVADRPDVVARQGVHTVQLVCPSSDVGGGNLGPATAVPMLGSRPYGVRGIFRASHDPNVVASDGRDRRRLTEVLRTHYCTPGRPTNEAFCAHYNHQQREARRQESRQWRQYSKV